jgi:hypothetical protein
MRPELCEPLTRHRTHEAANAAGLIADPTHLVPAGDPEPGYAAGTLPWIKVAPDAPYFVTEDGQPWTPVGQNDAISWVEFDGLFRRRDLPAIEAHLTWLRDSGVTCLRLMLEYAQVKHRYIERPMGQFVPAMVTLWDDLFAMCERLGLRILLTPFDTFWTWLRWDWHPYNVANGGCLRHPSEILLCGETRNAIKARFTFVIERWGGSGALFAWDLWNEIHPAQAGGSADSFGEFIHDLSQHVRGLEQRLYGRSHPQTVSLFGPEIGWRPEMPLCEPIFRHPDLDFASIHLYEHGTIDDPQDTVAPALSTGKLVRASIAEIRDSRPFLDSEHGPIHTFKDKRKTLPEPFDDEYFRHMQWAHIASGGAGGGMRWPNRKVHALTRGMRRAQAALADFLPLIDWTRFKRVNVNREVKALSSNVACFGCADGQQALLWLLRTDTIGRDGMVRRDVAPVSTMIRVPGMQAGRYRIVAWDTVAGRETERFEVTSSGTIIIQVPAFVADLALAITPA